jgi:hypothetical protein
MRQGRLTGVGVDAYTRSLDGIHFIDNCARIGLPVSDRGGAIAEREGGGLGRGIRRNGLADGVRSPRIGNAPLEGNDGFGGFIHGYVAVAFDFGHEAGRDYWRKYDFGQASGANLDQAACEYDDIATRSGSGRSGLDNSWDWTCKTGTALGNAEQSQDWRDDDVALEHTATAERYTEPTAGAS